MRASLAAVAPGLLALAQPALADDTLLQTVDLADQGWSTDGGEAQLFRLAKTRTGNCKIEAIHYGESGRTTYRFVFSDKLNYAARREYRYAKPYYLMEKFEMKLVREVLLSSREGKRMLPEEFATYRAFFDHARLAECSAPLKSRKS
jgi:hypothetical protein